MDPSNLSEASTTPGSEAENLFEEIIEREVSAQNELAASSETQPDTAAQGELSTDFETDMNVQQYDEESEDFNSVSTHSSIVDYEEIDEQDVDMDHLQSQLAMGTPNTSHQRYSVGRAAPLTQLYRSTQPSTKRRVVPKRKAKSVANKRTAAVMRQAEIERKQLEKMRQSGAGKKPRKVTKKNAKPTPRSLDQQAMRRVNPKSKQIKKPAKRAPRKGSKKASKATGRKK